MIAALWVEAQGIHLAANAIGDAFNAARIGTPSTRPTAGDLDHWLDEVLGHWAWHIAWVALAVLMLVLRRPPGREPTRRGRRGRSSPGAIPGVMFFFVTTEGDTWQLGIPACIVLLAWAGRDGGAARATRSSVFLVASSVATLLGS